MKLKFSASESAKQQLIVITEYFFPNFIKILSPSYGTQGQLASQQQKQSYKSSGSFYQALFHVHERYRKKTPRTSY